MQLHPKIQEFRQKVGNSPIHYSHRKTALSQPTITRAASSDNPRLLKQYFAVWGVPDDYGTIPVKGCFAKSIKERGPNSQGTYKIPALYMHSQRDSVGLPLILEEDEIGLYGEIPILEGIQVCDELIIRHKNKVTNNGSYGFDYIWDKMVYDDKQDVMRMTEVDLFEVSFVTIGSQKETFGVRGKDGVYTDQFLLEETEELIKKVARKDQLELRTLIDRHITLAKNQPREHEQNALEQTEPKHGLIDYDFLTKNF